MKSFVGFLRWPKRVNHKSVYQTTNQFSKTQISLPKHKTISRNTNQFPKTQIGLPKHKTISQNTNQFTKTQINFSKHKPISSKHKSKDWALALLLSESLERTHSQDFPRPTWRLHAVDKSKMFRAQQWVWSVTGIFLLLSMWTWCTCHYQPK